MRHPVRRAEGSLQASLQEPFRPADQHLPQAGAGPPAPLKQHPGAKRICRGHCPGTHKWPPTAA